MLLKYKCASHLCLLGLLLQQSKQDGGAPQWQKLRLTRRSCHFKVIVFRFIYRDEAMVSSLIPLVVTYAVVSHVLTTVSGDLLHLKCQQQKPGPSLLSSM